MLHLHQAEFLDPKDTELERLRFSRSLSRKNKHHAGSFAARLWELKGLHGREGKGQTPGRPRLGNPSWSETSPCTQKPLQRLNPARNPQEPLLLLGGKRPGEIRGSEPELRPERGFPQQKRRQHFPCPLQPAEEEG